MNFKEELTELRACVEAVEWVGNKTFKEAWNECERADWMLWLICKKEIGAKRDRIHVICDCAATSLKYVPKGEDRPRLAIEAAREYADKPTPTNLKKLNAAGAAAGDATGAAARAAAGAAAWAAAWAAAGDATRAAARAAAYKHMCKLIRKRIKVK